MRMSRHVLGWPVLAMLLASCVTINIYFPAAAAEEAARTIVRDVLGKEGHGNAPTENTKPQGEKSSALQQHGPMLWMLGQLMEQLVPAAHAANQPNIDISSPAISRLRASMSARQAGLSPFYKSGAVGFANNGLLAIRDAAAVSLRDRNKVKKLVADENKDRNALYREIARANGHPEWEKQIRSTFTKVWAQEAHRGYWVQSAGGGWSQR